MTDQPSTPAIDALQAAGVPFRVVRTAIAHDAEESASFQGIPVGSLLRSILVRRAADDFVFVLVPAGRRFDWPKLRAHLGTNRLSLPDQDEAKAETGYERGAITPFGARRPWPVIADASVEGARRRGGRRRRARRQRPPRPGRPRRATGGEVLDISNPEPPGRPPTTDDGRPGAARRDPRRRLLDGPRRALLHDAPRGPRRGRGQGRAARGRHDPRLGAAVGRRRGRRDADGGLLPRGQPQQALDPPRPQDRRGPRGPAAARCASDVLVENHRVGGFDRLGFGDDVLRELNPDLVHLAITGFGHRRARTPARPGYDFVAQAVGGLMSITGAADADGRRADEGRRRDQRRRQRAVRGGGDPRRALGRERAGTAGAGGQRIDVTSSSRPSPCS